MFIRLLNIARTAIFARILLPYEFGLFGIAALYLGLLEIITETGINVVLLQEQVDDQFIDTAWVVSIFRGVIVSSFIYLTSAFVGDFFKSPDSVHLIQIASLIPLIRGLINPSCVRFQSQLKFSNEFFYRSTLSLIEVVVSVAFVLASRSPVGLLYGLIASALVEVLLSFVVFKPLPKFEIQSRIVRTIFSRGKWVTGFGLFDYIFTNGDNIAVGKLLGSSALGLYQNAYRISTVPLTELVDIYYKISFPTYVKNSHSSSKLKSDALKSAALLSVTLISLGLLIAKFSESIVLILLGPNWSEASDLVKILAFVGVFRGISYSFNSYLMAVRLQKFVTAIIFTSSVALLISVVPLSNIYGLNGISYAALLGSLASIPVTLFLVRKALRLK